MPPISPPLALQVPRRADAKRAWGGMYAMDAHGGFGDAFAADGDVSLRGDSARSHDHCGHSSGHSSRSSVTLNGLSPAFPPHLP